MNFFKSILSEDPDPSILEKPKGSEPNSPTSSTDPDQSPSSHDDHISNSNSSDIGSGGGLWSFGGLVKTLTTRSESVLETYRRDLEEFGSGLKKETSLFREAASRVVKELPASIEVGASAAHGALDGVLKSTADAILAASSDSEPSPDTPDYRALTPRRYSRFESQLIAIRSDVNTYCEEPDDLDDYNKWKLGFVLEESNKEVENLINNDGAMEGIYKRVVPNEVDHDTFWCRYFYRVHKLKQQEDLRANLVRKARSIDDEEELSWDVDDDEETNVLSKGNSPGKKEAVDKDLLKEKSSDDESESKGGNGEKKSNVVGASGENLPNEKEVVAEQTSEGSKNELVSKSDKGVDLDGKGNNGVSCKDSDVSIVSTQPSLPEDEDLGWDEIEDLGSHDEKRESHGETPNRVDVRKRLSAAEEDEDLNWDIEEEDEPIKA